MRLNTGSPGPSAVPESVIIMPTKGGGITSLTWTGHILRPGSNYNQPFTNSHPTRNSGATPLYYAARCGFQDLVEWLIIVNKPEHVNTSGGYYMAPLVAALASGGAFSEQQSFSVTIRGCKLKCQTFYY